MDPNQCYGWGAYDESTDRNYVGASYAFADPGAQWLNSDSYYGDEYYASHMSIEGLHSWACNGEASNGMQESQAQLGAYFSTDSDAEHWNNLNAFAGDTDRGMLSSSAVGYSDFGFDMMPCEGIGSQGFHQASEQMSWSQEAAVWGNADIDSVQRAPLRDVHQHSRGEGVYAHYESTSILSTSCAPPSWNHAASDNRLPVEAVAAENPEGMMSGDADNDSIAYSLLKSLLRDDDCDEPAQQKVASEQPPAAEGVLQFLLREDMREQAQQQRPLGVHDEPASEHLTLHGSSGGFARGLAPPSPGRHNPLNGETTGAEGGQVSTVPPFNYPTHSVTCYGAIGSRVGKHDSPAEHHNLLHDTERSIAGCSLTERHHPPSPEHQNPLYGMSGSFVGRHDGPLLASTSPMQRFDGGHASCNSRATGLHGSQAHQNDSDGHVERHGSVSECFKPAHGVTDNHPIRQDAPLPATKRHTKARILPPVEASKLGKLHSESKCPLPPPFLIPGELAMSPECLIDSLPCNTTDSPYMSQLFYIYTHYMLLRYDTFSDLHEKVHILRTVIGRSSARFATELEVFMAEASKVSKLKPAALLKMAKAYFFGVRVVGIVFERPPPMERQCRNQKQQRSPPALLVEWDLVQTAQQRRLICEAGNKAAAKGAQARALTEHQIERMDMVVVSTADDRFSTIAHYATVVEVLDQYGRSVLRNTQTGTQNSNRFNYADNSNKNKEEPRPCRLLLEFVPMSSLATVCQLVSDCGQLIIVHFPVLLLSVLPMLDNLASLHAQLLKAEMATRLDGSTKWQNKRRFGKDNGKGSGAISVARHWGDEHVQEDDTQLRKLHYEKLLVDFEYPQRTTGDGANSIFSDITEGEIDEFIRNNQVDPSQAVAIKMCCTQPFNLIQGPPGTGKTHVARLVVKLIVERLKRKWREAAQKKFTDPGAGDTLPSKPQSIRILVMSFKNMSLDNICRGCIPYLPNGRNDILRLGGKSQSEEGSFTSQTEARHMYSHLPEFAGFHVGDSISQMVRVQTQLDMLLDVVHSATASQKEDVLTLGWQAFLDGASSVQCESLKAAGWSRDLKSVVYDEWLCADEAEVVECSRNDGANLWEIIDDVLAGTGLSFKEGPVDGDSSQQMEWDQEDLDEDEAGEPGEFDEKDERMAIRRELIGRMQQRGLVRAAPKGAIIKLGAPLPADNDGRDRKILATSDLFELPASDRHRLAALWQRKYLDRLLGTLFGVLERYEEAQKAMLSSIAERTAWLASQFMLTALTVTRSAMDRELLARIRPHVVIVEEAAEVLEASMLGGLFIGNAFESCLEKVGKKGDRKGSGKKGRRHSANEPVTEPHVILIGDHKQLQPNVSCEALELQMGFGLSMFERLAFNGLAVATLRHQRRMHETLTPLHRWIYAVEGVPIVDAVEDRRPILTVGGNRHFELPGLSVVICDETWEKERKSWRSEMERWNAGAGQSSWTSWRQRASYQQHELEPLEEPLPSNLSKAHGSRCLFVAHNSEEDVEGLSPRNENEAKIVCALVHFFVHVAGIRSHSITVLTPYKGQLHILRNMLKAMQLSEGSNYSHGASNENADHARSKSVDVQTVDTFQGEENDVIILSLTRCRRLTRFLQTQNRLCVSVSRARCASVLVGNPALLADLPDWQQIMQHMNIASLTGQEEEINTCVRPAVKQLGRKSKAACLFLVCPMHPTQADRNSCMTLATYVEQIHPQEEKRRWSMSSSWQGARHSAWQQQCSKFQCQKMCAFKCDVHGACKKLCHDHQACQTLVDRVLPCGHQQRLPCHIQVESASCSRWVHVTRASCGHDVRIRCSTDPESHRCSALVSVLRPGCQHSIVLECSVAAELGFRAAEMATLPEAEMKRRVTDSSVVRSVPLPDCLVVVRVVRPGCGHPTYVRCGDVKHLRIKSFGGASTVGFEDDEEGHEPEDLPLGPCPWVLGVERPQCGHDIMIRCPVWECMMAAGTAEVRRLWKRVAPKPLYMTGDQCPRNVISSLPLPPCREICRKLCANNMHTCTENCHAGVPCAPCEVEVRHTCSRCGQVGEQTIRCASYAFTSCFAERQIPHPRCQHEPVHRVQVPCHQSEDKQFLVNIRACEALTRLSFACGHSRELPCCEAHGQEDIKCIAVVEEINPSCSRGHTHKRKCLGQPRGESKFEYNSICHELVRHQFPCGHPAVTVECHLANESMRCTIVVDVPHPLCSRGHTCSIICANRETDPQLLQPCIGTYETCLPCGHAMVCACHENVENLICDKLVTFAHPFCQRSHDIQVSCTERENIIKGLQPPPACLVEIEGTLWCGHQGKLPCSCVDSDGNALGDVAAELLFSYPLCAEPRKKTRSCGHSAERRCFEWMRDPTGDELMPCEVPETRDLPCGHQATLPCHQWYAARVVAACTQTVKLRLNCGHTIEQPCREYCRPSIEDLTACCEQGVDVCLPCGHTVQVACNMRDMIDLDALVQECSAKVALTLPCGHEVKILCNLKDAASPELLASKCMEMSSLSLGCGHVCTLPCHKAREENRDFYTRSCGVAVARNLPCGHAVNLRCNQRHDDAVALFLRECYLRCEAITEKQLPCGHTAKILCLAGRANSDFAGECVVPTRRELPCGHIAEVPCHQASSAFDTQHMHQCTCPVKVSGACGHSLEVPCNQTSKQQVLPEDGREGAVSSVEDQRDATEALVRLLKVQPREGIGVPPPPAPDEHFGARKVRMRCTLGCTHASDDPNCKVNIPGSAKMAHASKSSSSFALCGEPVTKHRECGHTSTLPCHVWTQLQRAMTMEDGLPPCEEDVSKQCDCGNWTARKCNKWTGYGAAHFCRSPREKSLPCGHLASLPCHIWNDPSLLQHERCRVLVETKFECGHSLTHSCGDGKDKLCIVNVQRRLKCGHAKDMPCGADVASAVCGELSLVNHPHCGHAVSIPCGSDLNTARCEQVVLSVRHTCNHPELAACWLLRENHLGLSPWIGDPSSEPRIRESCESFPVIVSPSLPPCGHMVRGPHPICGCQCEQLCSIVRNQDGLELDQMSLQTSCPACLHNMLPTLSTHVRAQTKPADCMLLEYEPTRRKVTDIFIGILNRKLETARIAKTVGGYFSNTCTGQDVIAVESATSNRGSSGHRFRGKKGFHLRQQFLEHRLSLPPDLMCLSPMPFLAPVPSANYLRQLLLHGFPEAGDQGNEESLDQEARMVAAVMLSLRDPQEFARCVHGRRLAVLGLWLPHVPWDTPPSNFPSIVAAQLAAASAYTQGSQALEVISPRQLLPLYIFEI